jgi:hypothetical protein
MHRSVAQRPPHDVAVRVDPVLLPQPVCGLVDEDRAPCRRQQALHDAPEGRETARRHVGQEEAEEDDVVGVCGLQREGIGHPVRRAALPHLGAVQVEHLG